MEDCLKSAVESAVRGLKNGKFDFSFASTESAVVSTYNK